MRVATAVKSYSKLPVVPNRGDSALLDSLLKLFDGGWQAGIAVKVLPLINSSGALEKVPFYTRPGEIGIGRQNPRQRGDHLG